MIKKILTYFDGLGNISVHIARGAMVVVFLWIGGLNSLIHKGYSAYPFEGHFPRVISPDQDSVSNYKQNTSDGKIGTPEKGKWHAIDDTNSHAMGGIYMLIGLLIALYPQWPAVSAAGSFLAFALSLFTLILLIATPGHWTTAGDDEQGFPHLTTAGIQIVSLIIMIGASFVTMTDAAKKYLKKKQKASYLA